MLAILDYYFYYIYDIFIWATMLPKNITVTEGREEYSTKDELPVGLLF